MQRKEAPLYCIVGKSGAGKTTLVEQLENFGYKAVQSYTTRPPRYENEVGHIFLNDEKFDKLTDKIALTEYHGGKYCVTVGLLDKADLFIVEPEGINDLKKQYKKRSIKIVYLSCTDDILKERILKRGQNKEFAESRIKLDEVRFKNISNEANLIINGDLPKAMIINTFLRYKDDI